MKLESLSPQKKDQYDSSKSFLCVCVCSKEERKPYEWNNKKVSKDVISIFF